MGFRYRKRTKGKNSWFNYSFSKRGFNASYSIKFGDTTINLGRNGTRVTHNFGDGFIFTSSRKNKSKKQPNKTIQHSEYNTSEAHQTPQPVKKNPPFKWPTRSGDKIVKDLRGNVIYSSIEESKTPLYVQIVSFGIIFLILYAIFSIFYAIFS